MTDAAKFRRGRSGVLVGVACMLLIGVALLWIQAVNGGPLFYYDLHNYVLRGSKGLAMVLPDAWLHFPESAATRTAAASAVEDRTVNGSRSLIYSMLIAAFYQLNVPAYFTVLQALCVLAVVWITARVLLREVGDDRVALPVITLALLVAGFSALPFYVVYLMPDIFAPLLILAAGLVTVLGTRLTRWEWLVLVAISAFGVLSHPSHPLIVFALVPVAALLGWLARPRGRRRGAFLGAGFLIGLGLLGIAERVALTAAVQHVQKQQVIYWPFLTARLIEDGPGLSYLEENCPDPAIPTCVLYTALQASDDPMRLQAVNIVFSIEPGTTSFLQLPPADQMAVAQGQVAFAQAVFLDRPFDVTLSVLRNTGRQLLENGVHMTVPDMPLVEDFATLYPWLKPQRLAEDRSWLGFVNSAQAVLNIAGAALLMAVVFWPGPLRRDRRLLAAFVLCGVAANALICGAVSTPADRYGARVIWLLPFLATLLLVLQGRLGRRESP